MPSTSPKGYMFSELHSINKRVIWLVPVEQPLKVPLTKLFPCMEPLHLQYCLRVIGVLCLFWQEESLCLYSWYPKGLHTSKQGSSQNLPGFFLRGQAENLSVCECRGKRGQGLGTVGKCTSTFLLQLLCVKVPARFAAALVPAHVCAEVLLPDDLAVHRPLVPQTLKCQSSWERHRERKSYFVLQ